MRKLLLLVLLLGGFTAFSQGIVTGVIMDSDMGGPLSGANVIETGTTNGAISDLDGNFTLNVTSNSGTVTVSYLGYTNKKVSYTLSGGKANLGSISVVPDADSLGEVIIVGTGVIDLAEGRRTPVAVSTISAAEIQDRVVGNVEITEALKNTPSVHISGQSGFGDSQFYLRGFDQTNIAVLLNGQPINGMEDGKVYWSNWAGIADIANAIQVQRGLGASKLAISSVGGTTNIVMKAADRKEGGFARFLGANDSYAKGTIAYNTGKNEKGWAFSALVDYWQAHRKWAKGTYGQGQNYFFAVGYEPNEKHSFNFLLTGAPQLHGQKWSQSKEIIEADPKYNQHWGYTEDGIESERQNYYHKPVMNLNWDWTMSEKSELSTVLYASWGRGGGTGDRGNGRKRTEDPDGDGPLGGQIDYDAIAANNAIVGLGGDYGADNGAGYIRRSSVNNHQWYGVVSNFNHDITENLKFNVGVDGRMYTGDHFRQVTDLYGLSGWSNDRPDDAIVTATFDATPWAALTSYADEGDRINYDYSEDINYVGGFGQLEYASDNFSTFFQGSVSSQSYQREDRFENKTSEKVSRSGYNLKGGISYTIEESSTIFLNGGYYSRQPYLDNIFAFNGSNADLISPEVDNEIIRSFEAGYHYKINRFSANFNAYVTDWTNRTITNLDTNDNGTPDDDTDDFDMSILQRGIRQYHSGAEFDIAYRATDWLTLTSYISGGSWVYKGESSVDIYNVDTNQLISSEEGVDRNGVKVSSAPQFTTGLRAKARITSALSVDGNINYRAGHYEFTDPSTPASDYQPRQLSPYSITDFGLSYEFNLGGGNDLTFRGNLYNAFDYIGLQNTDAFGYYTENGRTYNASVKYNF
ncbi:TonB-dependent receptor [Ulvibacter litoralis]|uniref:Outer membrane receptor for ferrienterochelin and colicins n=1 Tax=Ulvibacter litoralis TaxID=227084 RepID=A0A1G7CZ99_9FLAO|nr:TonB-dependent receptor plug domain-containing protein [Ulvibacter litoralis]GHC45502.1 TonB-dependent receptor [Ulvibacter litoralis]SDE44563.1 Outer membrane receptor for ferrienterochelin and colicins [Ulvibacter litoralis]